MTRRHWSLTARKRIRDRFGGVCQMCQQEIGVKGFDLDHHIPLALGGEDVEENMRPLCSPCHRIKTATVDAPRIAKAKRVEAKHLGASAPARQQIPSRDFPKAERERKSTPAKLAGLPRPQLYGPAE